MKRIESPQNALVKHWKKLVTTRKERDKTEEFLVEGFHLVEEALKKARAFSHSSFGMVWNFLLAGQQKMFILLK